MCWIARVVESVEKTVEELRQSRHQPHVLHGRARGALAGIVEARDEERLRMLVAGEDIKLVLFGRGCVCVRLLVKYILGLRASAVGH